MSPSTCGLWYDDYVPLTPFAVLSTFTALSEASNEPKSCSLVIRRVSAALLAASLPFSSLPAEVVEFYVESLAVAAAS